MTFQPILPNLEYPGACPRCGSNYGYYERWRVIQSLGFTFAGVGDGGELSEYATGGKRKRCRKCQKDITSYVNSFQAQPKQKDAQQ